MNIAKQPEICQIYHIHGGQLRIIVAFRTGSVPVLKKEIRYIPPGFDWAVFNLIYIDIKLYIQYIIYIYIIILNRYYI